MRLHGILRGICFSSLASLALAAGPFGGCASPETVTIRVLTYNIHHGEGMDGLVDLQRIAAVIRQADADLVSLQEVDRGVARTARSDQPADLARLTGMHAVFDKNADMQGGDYGNAVLSRWPIARHRHHLLPCFGDNEQRGLLEVHVRAGDHPVAFLATHLDHQADDDERMASIAEIRKLVESQPVGATVILAGDLNAAPDSRVIHDARSFLRDSVAEVKDSSFTFPADTPDRRIDYILYRGPASLRPETCRVLPEAIASDHRPVLAEFRIGLCDKSGRAMPARKCADGASCSRRAPRR